ncbi:Ig-like domain-containing protein, partial [Pseudoalteromonas sp. Z9A5]|uniref:Ig-like domain-containing protein n=1 Tax=Pseudoalteromonas sp. Z9A5 TaxID=2686355 RepID=UPI001F0DC7FA
MTDAAQNTTVVSGTGEVDVTPPELAFTPHFELGALVSLNGTSDLPLNSEITITEQLIGGGVGISYTTTTDENGNWSFIGLGISLLDVASITASGTDAAGNIRVINSDSFDTTPPTLIVEIAPYSNSETPLISGNSDAGEGALVTLIVTDNAGVSHTLTTFVDANGDWNVTPIIGLSEGQSTVEVSVRDSVGNLTSVTQTSIIDTAAPTLTIQPVGDISDLTPELRGTSNEI